MKYLALDVGDRRIGTAIGDSDLRLATPVQVIERRSLEEDIRALAEIVRKYDVSELIAGLPRNMDETLGLQAQSVQVYAEKVAQALSLPLTLWDERLTTVDATERVAAVSLQKSRGGRRGKKSRRTIDAIAASVILQDFLDSHLNTVQ